LSLCGAGAPARVVLLWVRQENQGLEVKIRFLEQALAGEGARGYTNFCYTNFCHTNSCHELFLVRCWGWLGEFVVTDRDVLFDFFGLNGELA
jgi:hypothetical protein